MKCIAVVVVVEPPLRVIPPSSTCLACFCGPLVFLFKGLGLYVCSQAFDGIFHFTIRHRNLKGLVTMFNKLELNLYKILVDSGAIVDVVC